MSSGSTKRSKRHRFSDELIAGLAIQPHQVDLARRPDRSTRAALAEFDATRASAERGEPPAPNPDQGARSPGSFKDFERLLDQLGTPMAIEPGKPLPRKRHLPRRVGRCPSAHNRALFEKAVP